MSINNEKIQEKYKITEITNCKMISKFKMIAIMIHLRRNLMIMKINRISQVKVIKIKNHLVLLLRNLLKDYNYMQSLL